MRVISWNVNCFSWKRNENKVSLLRSLDWDAALLQEVSVATFREVTSGLHCDGEQALSHLTSTEHDVPVGAAILVRRGAIDRTEILPDLPLAERFLSVELSLDGETWTLASWHAPNDAGDSVEIKMSAYATVRSWCLSRPERERLVLGCDTNSWESGWEEPPIDVDHPFFEEHRFLRTPGEVGLRDAFRTVLASDPERLRLLLERRPTGALATTYVRGTRNHPVAERMDRLLVGGAVEVVDLTHHLSDAYAAGSDHAVVEGALR